MPWFSFVPLDFSYSIHKVTRTSGVARVRAELPKSKLGFSKSPALKLPHSGESTTSSLHTLRDFSGMKRAPIFEATASRRSAPSVVNNVKLTKMIHFQRTSTSRSNSFCMVNSVILIMNHLDEPFS